MTPTEFKALVMDHDYLYMYSDDHRAYKRGVAERNQIDAALKANPDLFPIFNEIIRER